VTITVRYFAAAAEAAGVPTETLDAAGVPTAGRLRAALVAAHGADLERVLTRCSLLAAGSRLDDDDAPLARGVVVDVLPPFAGG
jgi:sulfur-carrier protein